MKTNLQKLAEHVDGVHLLYLQGAPRLDFEDREENAHDWRVAKGFFSGKS